MLLHLASFFDGFARIAEHAVHAKGVCVCVYVCSPYVLCLAGVYADLLGMCVLGYRIFLFLYQVG